MFIDRKKLDEIRKSGIATKVRKSAPSWAKLATEEDVQKGYVSAGMDLPHRPGIIETLEGPKTFKVGDMICRGVKGEYWPMDIKTFNSVKALNSSVPADQDGFQTYFNTNTVWAIKIEEAFTVSLGDEPLTQTAGAYLIFNETGGWPLAAELFPTTYTPV